MLVCKRMIPDIGKEIQTLNAEQTRNARRKRLELQTLHNSSVSLTPESKSKSKLESSSHITDENAAAAAGEKEWSSNLVYGHVSIMGRRREMEDTFTVAPPGWLAGDYMFFGVYDGHGGSKAAETCKERMHKCLEKNIDKASEGNFDWEKVMFEGFSGVDEIILEEDAAEEKKMGSTAVVVVVGKEEIVVANCGDSRAVMYRGGGVVQLSRDHKPDRPDEIERIEAAGGTIVDWNGPRVQGVLAVTRSLGDHYLKPYVTSEPEVTVMTRTEADMFMVIATDGLWDVVSNELACEVVKNCLSGQLRRHALDGNVATEAAAVLAELAFAKGSEDNITIIVVML